MGSLNERASEVPHRTVVLDIIKLSNKIVILQKCGNDGKFRKVSNETHDWE